MVRPAGTPKTREILSHSNSDVQFILFITISIGSDFYFLDGKIGIRIHVNFVEKDPDDAFSDPNPTMV